MKVILQQDVKKVGKKGDILEVSEGYGRNFLLPKKYAVEANAANMNVAVAQKNSAERKKQQAKDESVLMAAQLAKIEVSIPVKIGENGKLFGSVTGKDVAEVLKSKHGIEIDKRKIEIKGDIKGLGEYEAVIKVHPEITSTIKVVIVTA
ncbi:MAG: 50S ribosomal protein L9 [Selenomonadaceae bacterium]|jgi:large subunit ribosomal protein L9